MDSIQCLDLKTESSRWDEMLAMVDGWVVEHNLNIGTKVLLHSIMLQGFAHSFDKQEIITIAGVLKSHGYEYVTSVDIKDIID